MGILAEAPVWHYWIGVVLSISGILMVLGMIAGYVVKVVMPRYPKRRP